ncbi:MAG: PTS sugar transporter subunit IIC [Neisseriaceae bacterium]|nr:PTS sugar transporter subunit IIC [Neisseriaceae bacterium]
MSFSQYLKNAPKRFFITAFSGMAQGLFVTLIAGTILAQIEGWIGTGNAFGALLSHIAAFAKTLMGAGIGVGIAYALNKGKLLTFSAMVAGLAGAFAQQLTSGNELTQLTLGLPGNPIGAYIVTMFVVELVALYEGRTKLDIILIPLGVLFLTALGIYLALPFIWAINKLGIIIAMATNAAPLLMGITVAVIMGILLTLPTSSAAMWIAVAAPILTAFKAGTIGQTEYDAMLLAGGAATVGCACHMVGFAVASFKENGVSGLISQGIGTSMLQIPNVMRKPVIMLPMIISSAICGALSTTVFMLKCGAAGGGMGTSGLVGVFDLLNFSDGAFYLTGVVLLMFILPAVLNWLISELMRNKGLIQFGDMKLDD